MLFFKNKKRRSSIQSKQWLKPSRTIKTSRRRKSTVTKAQRRPLQRRSRWSLTTQILVLVVLISVLSYLVFFRDTFLIQNITVQAANSEDPVPPHIHAILKKYVQTNLFLVSSSTLAEQLMTAHPYIESVDVRTSFPDQIEVTLAYYPPLLTMVLPETKDYEKKRFIVNSHGMVAPTATISDELPLFILKNVDTEVAAKIIADEIRFHPEHLQKALAAIDLFQQRLSIAVDQNRYFPTERELHMRTAKGFDIWIDLTKDVTRQIAKLEQALPMLDIYSVPLQYIDLRIDAPNGEKIIYKRK